MECTLDIDSDLLKNRGPISYKYLIRSQSDESEISPYEFINGAPGGKGDVINRCLIIDTNNFQESGMRVIH